MRAALRPEPAWSLTAQVAPPATPSAASPSNGATGMSTSASLTWNAAGATSYDVSFGTTNPPPQVATALSSASFAPSGMTAGTTYFWQIVARNAGGTTAGSTWSLTTQVAPPATPTAASPSNGATGMSTSASLTWNAAGATSYDVSFGTTNPPPQVATALSSASFAPSGMTAGTTYFWQVVARNAGGTTAGPAWSLTTQVAPPATPTAASPSNGATGVSTSASLTWSAAGATSYDVSFGTTNPPPQVATALSSASFAPSGMTAGTTYFWQVVARNAGGTTSGPVWSFATVVPPPPASADIVVYASDVPTTAMHGSWTTASDASSPNGRKLVTSDLGVANTTNALASPTDYVDVTFSAPAGTPYRLWMRLQALGNSKYNDSLFVQFSGRDGQRIVHLPR